MVVPFGTVFSLEPGLFASSDISESHQISDASQSTAALVEEALEALELTEESAPTSSTSTGHSAGTTCLTCGISAFDSPEDQRQHFKTDWHRFNVKRKLAGLDPVTEDQFLALIENDEDRDAVGSLSGSDSETEEDSENEGENQGIATTASGPQFIFSTADGKHYSVWRCLVAPDRERGVEPPSSQACLASLGELSTSGGRWAIILLRGGHFSAAVYDIKPPKSSKTSATAAGASMQKFSAAAVDAALNEVLHKSFHKYVVRAKAGGKQSTKDATGKYARSAGSRLRRHNEAALQRDIAEMLSSWKESLDTCSLILIAAPGSNGKTLFAGDSPMLNKGDSRLRRIPFVTRRPTQSETKRVARVLLTVYDASAIAAATEAAKASEESAAEEKKKGKQEESKKMVAETVAAAEEQAAKEREEALKAKKAEKRARQKQKEKEKRQAEAVEKAEAAAEAAKLSAEDEISRAARQAAAVAQRAAAQAAQKAAASKQASAQASAPPPRLSSKPLASEDAATRRARMASAAEARLKALQAASSQQKLY